MFRPVRNALSLLVPEEPPLELQLVGRTLLHAALVGLLAGLFGCAFLYVLEQVQHYVLEQTTGYAPLRAAGDVHASGGAATSFRWWLLLFIPAIGVSRVVGSPDSHPRFAAAAATPRSMHFTTTAAKCAGACCGPSR